MAIEQLAVGNLEKMNPETSGKPFFSDSDREQDIELPPVDLSVINEKSNHLEGGIYPDSDRSFSEGPQWDEQEVDSGFQEKEETEKKDLLVYNEDGMRELTNDEKRDIEDKLGWSDDKLKKCSVDEKAVVHYKTDRCDLEGQTSANGVPYERRMIEINGVKIEGVFPKFESVFDMQLDPDNYKSKTYAKECNIKLREAVENDLELRNKFSPEQLKDIEDGRTVTGYVWHHNEEPGKMQLVKREDHDRVIGGAAHTGGNSLWGPDSVDNNKKGECF